VTVYVQGAKILLLLEAHQLEIRLLQVLTLYTTILDSIHIRTLMNIIIDNTNK